MLSCLLGVKCSSSFQKLDPSDLIDIKQPYWRVEGQVPHNPPGATTVILQELSYYAYLLQKLFLMLHSLRTIKNKVTLHPCLQKFKQNLIQNFDNNDSTYRDTVSTELQSNIS